MKTTRQNLNGSRTKKTQWGLPAECYELLAKEAKQTGKTVDQLGNECLREYFAAMDTKPEQRVRVVTEIPVSILEPFARWQKAGLEPVGLAMNAEGQPLLCMFQEEDEDTVETCIPIPLHEAVERFSDAIKPEVKSDFDYTEGIGEFFTAIAKGLKAKSSR